MAYHGKPEVGRLHGEAQVLELHAAHLVRDTRLHLAVHLAVHLALRRCRGRGRGRGLAAEGDRQVRVLLELGHGAHGAEDTEGGEAAALE